MIISSMDSSPAVSNAAKTRVYTEAAYRSYVYLNTLLLKTVLSLGVLVIGIQFLIDALNTFISFFNYGFENLPPIFFSQMTIVFLCIACISVLFRFNKKPSEFFLFNSKKMDDVAQKFDLETTIGHFLDGFRSGYKSKAVLLEIKKVVTEKNMQN